MEQTIGDYQGCNCMSGNCVPFPWADMDSSHFPSPDSGPGGRCTCSQRVSRIKERTDIKVHIHSNSCGKSQSVLSRYYYIVKLIKSHCFPFFVQFALSDSTSFQYLSLRFRILIKPDRRWSYGFLNMYPFTCNYGTFDRKSVFRFVKSYCFLQQKTEYYKLIVWMSDNRCFALLL